jgi:NFU1 iron-sulfur cluster scaffold homolog, mitochondrial
MADDKIPVTAQVHPANPRVCSFTVGKALFPGDSYNCASAEMAKGSPLLEALFAVPGVAQAWVMDEKLTVEKDSDEEWPVFGKRVAKAVREVLRTPGPWVVPGRARSGVEEHIRKRAREVLEAEINPSLAAHGGRVDVADVKGTTVEVVMSGGCQGCGSSAVTMRQGVERSLLSRIPEVSEVVDVTDHAAAAGANPFYAPGETGDSPV